MLPVALEIRQRLQIMERKNHNHLTKIKIINKKSQKKSENHALKTYGEEQNNFKPDRIQTKNICVKVLDYPVSVG